MRRQLIWGLPLALLPLAAPARASADDLKGAQTLLCTAEEATVCSDEEGCVNKSLEDLNIPHFLELNLTEKRMSTTKASGENRSTPFRALEREDGLLLIQGIEQGRAFSFVISESTGALSVAVARDGISVSVFGACTPLSTAK